ELMEAIWKTGLGVGVLSAALALGAVGCAQPAAEAGTQDASADAQARDPGPDVTASNWPEVANPLPADPELERRVDELLAAMTVEEKVGQIVQGDIDSLTPEDVREYRLGSILAGGNSDPGGRYDAPPEDWLALADALWEA